MSNKRKSGFPSKRKRYRDITVEYLAEISSIPGVSGDKLSSSEIDKDDLEVNKDEGNIISDLLDVSASESDLSDQSCSDQSLDTSSDFDYSVSDESENSEPRPTNSRLKTNENVYSSHSGIEKFRDWAIQYSISHQAIDSLLGIIPELSGVNIPKDSRTLLHTPRTVEFQKFPGENACYSYLGLKKVLIKAIRKGTRCDVKDKTAFLTCKFNIDGLPIANSKSHQMWPLLCQVKESNMQNPQIVALYTGNKKPDKDSWVPYFKPFVDECKYLHENGIKVDDVRYYIAWDRSMFICDSPGRASIKFIKHHNSRFGCDYCQQEGRYDKCMNFETRIANLRTDTNFRSKEQEEHHNGTSPLEALNIDMIQNFPIDYMHLICIGIVKKLLLLWINGPIALKVRQPSRVIDEISQKLISAGKSLPNYFSRRHQSLSVASRWKATELRSFVLYTGPIVLKGLLPKPLYDHFLLLHLATFILVSPELSKDQCDYAQYLIDTFVKESVELYKKSFVVYNVHLLMHLPYFVKKFGNLDEFSCFPFENFLYVLKNIIRTKYLPHQQVMKRLCEYESNTYERLGTFFFEKPRHKFNFGEHCLILNKNSDYYYCEHSKKTEDGEIEIRGKQFTTLIDLYTTPVQSSRYNIFIGSGFLPPVIFRCRDYKVALCFPFDNGSFVIMPLSHTC